jgi:hypothetical protein
MFDIKGLIIFSLFAVISWTDDFAFPILATIGVSVTIGWYWEIVKKHKFLLGFIIGYALIAVLSNYFTPRNFVVNFLVIFFPFLIVTVFTYRKPTKRVCDVVNLPDDCPLK